MATAATDVADLQVRIDVATELLRTELNRANASIAQFADKADRSLNEVNGSFARVAGQVGSVIGSLAGLAGVAGVSALAGSVRTITQEMDDLAASAERVGLSAEQFQELRFGLERLDVSTETASAALQRLLVTTGAAAQGNKAAAATFARLGVSLRDLTTLNPGQVFDRVATGLGEIESPAERSRIAAQLFGREAGPQLAAALADGGAALRQWAQTAQQSGQIVSEGTVQGLARANDKIEQFNSRLRVLGTQALGFSVNFFSSFGFAKGSDRSPAEVIAGAERELAKYQARLAQLNRAGDGRDPLSGLLNVEAAQLQARIGGLRNVIAGQRAQLRSVPAQVSAATLPGVEIEGRGRVAPSRGVEGATTKVRDLRTEVQKAQDDLAALFERIRATPVRPEIEGLTAPERLPDAGARANESLRTIPDLSADPSFQASQKVLDDIAESSEVARQRAAAFTDALAQGLADAVVNGGNFGEVLKRLAVQLLVVEPLAKALRGLFSGGGAGGAGGAAGGAGGGGFGAFLGSIFGGFFADGGVPPLGKVSVVGERGPEFIVPRSPVEVLTAAQMARRVGGGGGGGPTVINQTLNFGTDLAQVRDQISQAAPQIAAQAALAVERARRNAGIPRK